MKKLYKSINFPYHMIVETLNNGYKMFSIIPARKITEKDLSPIKFWKPRGKQSEEAEPYLYNMYRLEKAEEE